MKRIIVIICIAFGYFSLSAQTISDENFHIIPYPNNNVRLIGLPIVFNNKLYLQYQGNPGNYLGEVNGNSIRLIPNIGPLDRGYLSSPVIFNNKLFFGYGEKLIADLAQFDGNKITIIPGFDNHYQFDVVYNPVVCNGKLYVQFFQTGNLMVKLSVFDGNSLKIADNYYLANCNAPMLVYNNKVYFRNESRTDVEDFDGIKTERLPTNFVNISTVYNNKLIGFAHSSKETPMATLTLPIPFLDWILWDGTKASRLILPDDSASVSDPFNTAICNSSFYFFVNFPHRLYNKQKNMQKLGNNVCMNYEGMANVGSLDDAIAKYDGKKITIFPSLENSSYTSKFVTCNNKVYALLTTPADPTIPNAKNITKLVECDGSALKIIPNPGDGSLKLPDLVAYNNKIYVEYENQTAIYDGKKFTIIPWPCRICSGYTVLDNRLYIYENFQLGYYDISK